MSARAPRLLGQFSWVTGGHIVSAATQVLFLVILARLISPDQLGLAFSLVGAGIVLQAVFDLGLTSYMARESPRGARGMRNVSAALRLNFLSAIGLAMVFGLMIIIVARVGQPEAILLLPFALSFSAEKVADARGAVAVGTGRAAIASISLIARRIVAMALFSVLIVLADVDVMLAYSTALAFAASGSAVAIAMIIRVSVTPEQTSVPMIAAARQARWFYLNGISTHARNIDVTLVALLAGPGVAGLFAVVRRIVNPLLILPTALATVLLPAVSRASTLSALNRILRLIAFVTSACFVPFLAVAVLSPLLVPVVLGEDYENSVFAFQIVCLSLPFAVGSSLLTSFLQGIGRAAWVGKITLAVTLTGLAALAAAARLQDLTAISVAFALTFVLQFGIQAAALVRSRR